MPLATVTFAFSTVRPVAPLKQTMSALLSPPPVVPSTCSVSPDCDTYNGYVGSEGVVICDDVKSTAAAGAACSASHASTIAR